MWNSGAAGSNKGAGKKIIQGFTESRIKALELNISTHLVDVQELNFAGGCTNSLGDKYWHVNSEHSFITKKTPSKYQSKCENIHVALTEARTQCFSKELLVLAPLKNVTEGLYFIDVQMISSKMFTWRI